eukprot:scaffold8_cov142-Skeletonema_marinoi.AAC.17
MEYRDSNYYQANAADVNLEEITSSAQNAKILQRLRDGDPTLSHFSLGRHGEWGKHCVGEGDDMGWLGYFIGKSQYLRALYITYLPNGEEAHAFAEGIARNKSIRYISIIYLSNDGFTSIVRELDSLSQLQELSIYGNNSVGPDGWSELRTLLESGVCHLKQLRLHANNYIGNEGVDVLSNGLRGIGTSLKVLMLTNNSIGNEGLLAVVEALQTCTGLETLNLSGNEFSLAAAGLASLSDLLRRDLEHLNLSHCRINDEGLHAFNEGLCSFSLEEALQTCTSLETLDLSCNEFSLAGLGSLSDFLRRDEVNLKRLNLFSCRINDEGLHVLSQGAANHCEELYLGGFQSITTTGLSYLSNSIRSDSCCVEALDLRGTRIGDDGMEVLAHGLAGNKSVRSLYLDAFDNDITIDGWAAFSTTLCDTSNVNSTYLSNHTICSICEELYEELNQPQDIYLYLGLNRQHPQHAARCKILMKHPHLDMTPFLQWKLKLKLLPLAVAWFERAKPCTSLTICEANSVSRRRVLEESSDDFQNRVLSAMYEFVRGMPMEVMKSREELIVMAYDDKIAMAEEEIKMLREDVEQRERNFTQVEEEKERLKEENKGAEEEIKMLREDLEQRDRKITQLEEENERLSKIALFLCVFAVFLSSKSFSLLLELMRSSSLDL